MTVQSANGVQLGFRSAQISESYNDHAEIVIAPGNCLDTMGGLPGGMANLIITSPPYNIGKEYERATGLERYLDALSPVVDELVRVLSPRGSLV